MKKIKNMLKKGGVADIVTLMVIVGLVIALLIAVVLPMVHDTKEKGGANTAQLTGVSHFTTAVGTVSDDGTVTIGQENIH